MLPLRRSACPTYLSYEQTLSKLAEEAKFYRFTKLQRALPLPPSTNGVATLHSPENVHRHAGQSRNTPTPQSRYLPLPAAPAIAPSPVTIPAPLPPPIITSLAGNSLGIDTVNQHTGKGGSHSKAPSLVSSRPPSRSHSRRPSIAEPPEAPPSCLSAYIYRPGQFGVRRGEPLFELVDYPDDVPMPHLFLRIVNAEIKYVHPPDRKQPNGHLISCHFPPRFSAFRNATNQDVFELRWSLRVLDEPSTRECQTIII